METIMTAVPKYDPRIKEILNELSRFSKGDYKSRLNVLEHDDGLESVKARIAALGGVLDERERALKERELKIENFLKTLSRFTTLDSSEKGTRHAVDDKIDPVSKDLNTYTETFLRHLEQLKAGNGKISVPEHREPEHSEALIASEDKYRYLFQSNPMALWVLDTKDLKFLDVNDSALKLYGYSREEFLSMSSVELRPEEERARYLALNRTPAGIQNTGTWQHRKKDGTIIHAEVIVKEFEFEGKPARLILSNNVTDKVSAFRDLQISEARFRRIVDSKMIGFIFWQENDKITESNDLFLEMLGYTRSDLEKGILRLSNISPPEYTNLDRLALEQIKSTGVCEPYEKEYIRKDGTRLSVMVGAADISDDASLKAVTVVMDISERKRMEQEILDLNRSLEIRIEERTKALQEVNKELKSFTYSVSHDLRTPLRAIHGYSQILSDDYKSRLDEEGVRLLDSIQFNAQRMGQLVDDLLALSRVSKIMLSETQTDVTLLVNDLLKDLVTGLHKPVRIIVHPLGTAHADNNLLRRVFENLLSNAIKYSSKKEDPLIEIGVKEIEGQRAFYVKDNGAGFDMAYYKKLFGVFERLHDQDEFEGIGVGLAIAQRIVHRHGGKIWAVGKVGEGAEFYFTL